MNSLFNSIDVGPFTSANSSNPINMIELFNSSSMIDPCNKGGRLAE